MKTIRNIYMLCWALGLSLNAVAQTTATSLTPGYRIFGLNAGLAYQSSDVKATSDGFGFGATLGRNVYYRPGAPLAFDLRGRFLYTNQYGLDALRDFRIAGNRALNGTGALNYTIYPAALEEPRGFVYQNHKTTTAELGLEGLITLNRLREQSRIHVGLFGGMGLNWFQARTDQAGADGKEYFAGYANINENRGTRQIRNELLRLLDGEYETIADGNEDGGTLRFMPSLGLELGYYLSPRFLVYGGHRTTFSGTDALDGQRFADPNTNDWYHYTNVGLRWLIPTREDRPLVRLPEIEIVSPLGSPYISSILDGLVVANIRNVNSAADVECLVNGRTAPFDYRNGRFSLETRLRPGSNEVTIVARNQHGQDRKMVVLVYQEPTAPEPPRVQPPRVRFINPAGSTARTDTRDFDIQAVIDNVTDRQEITLTVNGAVGNFNFDNGVLRANILLREGDNRVQIRARNATGSDSEEVNIIREARILLPTVDITEPTGSRVESAFRDTRLSANVRHVELKNDITITQNGRSFWNFDFDPNRGLLTANLNLDNGANNIVVTVRNQAGEARDEVTIVYQEPLPEPRNPPAVRIIEPGRATTTTTQLAMRIEATISNVRDSQDIQFSVNGARRTDFSFDSRNGRLTANVNLLVGNNDIVIRAVNRDGEDQQSVIIRRIEETVVIPRPPVVRITAPANNSETRNEVVEVRANLDNITMKNEVDLTVNGRRTTNFNFSRGQITAQVSLIEGNNAIRIRATNNDGSDEATVNVRYRPGLLPTVQITTPANNSTFPSANISVRARVDNVESQSQIRLLVNGQANNFNYDRTRREVSASINLDEGDNVIRIEAQSNTGMASDQITVRYRRAAPPTVRIIAPANNSTVQTADVELRAQTTNVSNRSEATIRLNGNAVTNFSLNGGDLTARLTLREGVNTISVRVSNSDGSDEASINTHYEPLPKPTVTILEPNQSPFVITQNTQFVRATVHNVTSRSNLSVSVNGSNFSAFNFDANTGEVTLRAVNLRPGDNSVAIRANNTAGSTEAEVILRYRTPQPPTVTITEPRDGSRTETNQVTVRAVITNVIGSRNIGFRVNGRTLNNFEINGDEFTATVDLQAGENLIAISARNEDGVAETSAKVTFELKAAQLLEPNVRIVQPSKPGITVKEKNYNLRASIANVAARSELSIWLNDDPWTNFSYNPRDRQLSATISLQPGKNIIRVQAQNKGGTHEAETNITYEAGDVPVITIVSISQPTANPFRPQASSSTIIATIERIEGQDDVKILVNGEQMNDFSFDPASKKLEATVQLKKGENIIVIRATNENGTSEVKRTVEF